MPTDLERCRAKRKDGMPCQAPAIDDGYCFAHSPARKAERDEARRRGGRNSAKVVRLRGMVPPRLLPVFDLLETALTECHEGKISPRQAQGMAALARAMVSVLQAGELEERVRNVESELQRREAHAWRA